MSLDKAMTATISSPKLISSVQVMYICITSLRREATVHRFWHPICQRYYTKKEEKEEKEQEFTTLSLKNTNIKSRNTSDYFIRTQATDQSSYFSLSSAALWFLLITE